MRSKRWSAAPESEWVLMYRRGLGRGQIAEQSGAPVRTVGYHLAVARRLDPGLQEEHAAATGAKPARVTRQGLVRMAQLVAMVQGSGKYPSTKSSDGDERALAAWLNRRRRESKEGTLPPEFRDGLKIPGDWQDLRRSTGDEARWQERLAALAAYRESGHDWPRHKTTSGGLEHELGVWIHTQRYKERRGELDPSKVAALDARVPGWRSGRTRGRKPIRDQGTSQPIRGLD